MWPKTGPISTWLILYSLGLLTHFVMGWRIAAKLALRRRIGILVSCCYLPAMTVGAKILYDIINGSFAFSALIRPEYYLQEGLWGGLAVYFALAVPLVLWLCKDRNRDAGLDLVALTVPIPWIFAKTGCLLNGCCYGLASSMPWAITFPENAHGNVPKGVPIHPTQLYEILLMILILVVFKVFGNVRWQGTKLLWFLSLYGLGRGMIEIWRGDVHRHLWLANMTYTQLICLLVAAVSGIILCYQIYCRDY